MQLAVTENVANLSEYYLSYEGPDGLTNPAQGDLILLTAQTTTSENGIYEVSSVTSTYDSNQGGSGPTASDYYVSLARAIGFDSSEEFITGSFVFVEKGSQVGQGYVLGELASDFALGTSPVNYLQFTVDTTKDVTFDQSVSSSSLASSGELTVSGNSSLSNVTVTGDTTMNGNATMNGNVNLSGVLDAGAVYAELLYVSGYMGSSQIDGMSNRIRGDSLELDHINTLISGDVHMMDDLNVSDDLYVSDGLYVSGPVDFSYSSEVRVPTPDQDDEAANKSYVDSAISTEASSRDAAISDAIAGDNARGLVQLAATENVANLSEYYLSYEGPDGLTNPAQGDLILLTAQTTTSENGIYEVSSVTSTYDSNQGGSGPTASDYYVSLARASGFDSSEEFITGSFVFVEKGSQVGQGYVLGELASDFALGTSPVNYLQFTVDTTKDVTFDQSVSSSSLASSGELTVSGNSSLSNVTVTGDTTMNGNATMNGNVNLSGVLDAGAVYAELLYVSGYMGSSQIDGMSNRIRGDSLELDHINTLISGDVHMMDDLNVSDDLYVSDGLYVSGPVDFSYSSEVRVPTPDQDDEAANKSYVDSAISTEASSRDAAISDAIAGDNARGLVQLAATENVANLSEYYLSYEGPDGLTNPAQGDLILLTAQTTTSENGIYEVSSVTSTYDSNQGGSGPTASDYYVSLARASGFDSSEEFITGSFVFVEKGSQVGQGYVLGELASDFALGTSPVNYLQFTVDTTKDVTFDQSVSSSSLASSGELTVSGNSSLSNVTVSGDTAMNGDLFISGGLSASGPSAMTSLTGQIGTSRLYVAGSSGLPTIIDGADNEIYGNTSMETITADTLRVHGSLGLTLIDGTSNYIYGNTAMNGNVSASGNLVVSGAMDAGEIHVNSPNGPIRIDGVNNYIYGNTSMETISVDALTVDGTYGMTSIGGMSNEIYGDTSLIGDTYTHGNVSIGNNVSISGSLNTVGPVSFTSLDVVGVINASRFDLSSPNGTSRIDGMSNRIRGDSLELNHIDTYISGDVHMSEDLNVSDDLIVSDALYVSGPVDFSYSSEVRVPTPDQDDEAANKSYVDNLVSTSIAGDNARGLVQLAVTENVANLSEYYLSYEGPDGLTNPAQGDLILLIGQTTTSENGIYEVSSVTSTYDSNQGGSGPTASDYYVSLARASGFDSSEEFITGSFVFVEKGSQVGQGYVLGELASDFALGTSPVNYLQFTVDTTKDVTFDQSVSSSSLASSGELTVSGNSSLSNVTVNGDTTMNGNATMNGNVNVSGVLDADIVDADELYVQGGPAGSSRIDGMINRIRGDILDLNHVDTNITGSVAISGNTSMNGNASIDGDVNVFGILDADIVDTNMLYVQGGPAGSSRIDGMINRIRGDILELNHMDTNITGNVVISDALYVSGPVDFSYSSEVRVPTPDQDDEAANKSYVDNLVSTSIAGDNARGLVQLAVTENVANLSEYYLSYEGPDGLANPAQGDLILLTAQTTTSENGIYEVSSVTSTYDSNQGGSGPTASDYYVTLARASDFDSSEEFITGSFVFVEKGSQVGQGYVLGELASDFALGTSPVNYLQFTVDTTKDVTFDQSVSSSSLASSGELTVSGNSSLSNVTVNGDTTMNGNATMNGHVNVSGVLDADIVDTNMLYVQGGPAGSSRIDV